MAYTPDALLPAVAELTIGLILDLARGISVLDKKVRSLNWKRYMGRRVEDLTIGIMGVGRIGFWVIRLLQRFRCRILAHDRNPLTQIGPDMGVTWVEKEDLLRKPDIVSLHLPLTTETKGIISTRELGMMKKDTAVINTSRGGIVDEAALSRALKQGVIRAAALDVFEEDPYTGALREVDNVLLTQHMCSCTVDCRLRMELEATEDAVRFLKSGALCNPVPVEYYVEQTRETSESNGTMRHVALFTAKGNNQSLPDKNLIPIVGKPALQYVIEAAKGASGISEVFLSTEDPRNHDLAEVLNCRIIDRPSELSQPDTNHGDVMRHGIDQIKKQIPDIGCVTVLLGNTVMTNSALIDLSLRILDRNKSLDSVMSVWQAQDDHPYRALKMTASGTMESFLDIKSGTSRQYYPAVFIHQAIAEADIVACSHSTAVLEAVLQDKPFLLVGTRKWGDYFEVRDGEEPSLFVDELGRVAEAVERIVAQTDPTRIVRLRERVFGTSGFPGMEWVVRQAVGTELRPVPEVVTR